MGMCSIKVTLAQSAHIYQLFTVLILGTKTICWGFPGDSVVRILFASAGDRGSTLVQEDPTGFGAAKPMCHNC